MALVRWAPSLSGHQLFFPAKYTDSHPLSIVRSLTYATFSNLSALFSTSDDISSDEACPALPLQRTFEKSHCQDDRRSFWLVPAVKQLSPVFTR